MVVLLVSSTEVMLFQAWRYTTWRGKRGQTCRMLKTSSPKGRACEKCGLCPAVVYFLEGLMNLKKSMRLLVWPDTQWRGFNQQDLQHPFHTLVQTLVYCSFSMWFNASTGGKKLNFSTVVTAFILSTGTDLLILEGQTGPAHNNTRVASSIFPLQWETHLFGMTAAEGLIVPPVLELLLSLWQTHLVPCHLRLILHRLDMFPIQKDLRVS